TFNNKNIFFGFWLLPFLFIIVVCFFNGWIFLLFFLLPYSYRLYRHNQAFCSFCLDINSCRKPRPERRGLAGFVVYVFIRLWKYSYLHCKIGYLICICTNNRSRTCYFCNYSLEFLIQKCIDFY